MVHSPSSSLPAGVPGEALDLTDATEFSAQALWPFLAMAAHEPDAAQARKVGYLQRFLCDWPRQGDFGFVVSVAGAPAGAVWARQFTKDEAADFFVGEDVPELVLAVQPHWRGTGLGHRLLNALISAARLRPLKGLCLTVREDNRAAHLYRRAGFDVRMQGRNRVGGLSLGMVLPIDAPNAQIGEVQ